MKFGKHLREVSGSNFIKKIIESFLGRISFIILYLVFTLVCARVYGPELFGEFTFVFTLMQIIMVLATLRFNNGLMYSIPKDGSKYVSLSLLLNAITSICLMILFSLLFNDNLIILALPLIWLLSME